MHHFFRFQNSGASGSATSVDLGDLPFDMPKLRRRLRVGGVNLTLPANISCNTTAANALNNNKLSTDTSGASQASSSQSVQQDDRPIIGESEGKFILFCLLMIMMMFRWDFLQRRFFIRLVNDG